MYALGFAPNNDNETHPFKKAQKDIRKYNVYIENDSEDEDIEVQVTRSGIPYLKFDGCSGINISKKQKSSIGPDALFILIETGISRNNIMIKDIVVRKFKNLKVSGKAISGAK